MFGKVDWKQSVLLFSEQWDRILSSFKYLASLSPMFSIYFYALK